MKCYPSIPTVIQSGTYVFGFDKLDGSQIRAEYNNKKGFYKFGSKSQLIDKTSKQFGKSIDLIQDLYSNDLSYVFKENKWDNIICFQVHIKKMTIIL